MAKDDKQIIEKKLDTVIELLQHLLAFVLFKGGVTQEVIGKRLHVVGRSDFRPRHYQEDENPSIRSPSSNR